MDEHATESGQRVYLCRRCVEAAAHLYQGWQPKTVVDDMQQVNMWKAEADGNKRDLETAQQRVAQLERDLSEAGRLA